MVLTYHARVFIISCLVLLALLPSADAQNLDTPSSTSRERALKKAPKASPADRNVEGKACEVMGPCGRCDCREYDPLLLPRDYSPDGDSPKHTPKRR